MELRGGIACSETLRLQDGFRRSSSRDHRAINRGGFSMVTTNEETVANMNHSRNCF